MEGLFDNFLYIIITIAVLAFSMMNKKKKTEEAQRRAPQKPGSIFDPFEEIFSTREEEAEVAEMEEEDYLEPEAPIRRIPNHPNPYNVSVNEGFNAQEDNVFEKLADKKILERTKAEIEEDGMIIDMKYDWDSEEEIKETIDFDLRSAVIQSEVLNRKYS